MNNNDMEYLRASNGEGEPIIATLTRDRVVGQTEFWLDNLYNFPDKFIGTVGKLKHDGYLEPTTMTIFYGSRSTLDDRVINIDKIAPGYTDRGNSQGDHLIIKPTTEWANLIQKSLAKVSLLDNGSGKNATKMIIEFNNEVPASPEVGTLKLWLKPLSED